MIFSSLTVLQAVYEFATEDLIDHGEIGQGAFGQVNRMEHKYTGRLMAVKV